MLNPQRVEPVDVTCPVCNGTARKSFTRHGLRHDCCGLHSWGGKPLVSREVHQARQAFHCAFDRLWNKAETAYVVQEPYGSPEHERAVKRIRKAARGRAYFYIAAVTGLPEPECHGATQDDLSKLARITEAAKGCADAIVIRDWYMATNKAAAE